MRILFTAIVLATCAMSVDADEARTVPSPRIGFVNQKPTSGRYVERAGRFMIPYRSTIPGTDVSFEMVPIPGGIARIGSEPSERQHHDDEGPPIQVRLDPFWIGKYEVTYNEYRQFMLLNSRFQKARGRSREPIEVAADTVTAPTDVYEPLSRFPFNTETEGNRPAATMTEFAARQYTKWLSMLTGHTYRLPTEAEWEYACRAGTKSSHSFDDQENVNEYAWYRENAEQPQSVGQKKPNRWGLYDMHGNVAEMCLDQYDSDAYARHEAAASDSKTMLDVFGVAVWSKHTYGHVLRGGNFDSSIADMRSAARDKTSDQWHTLEARIPPSPWWYADDRTLGVGFRIVRQVAPPESEDRRRRFWSADTPELREIVDEYINEGRANRGRANIGK